MKRIDLFERDKKGEIKHTTDHTKLYHITNARGMSHMIDTNQLKAFRQNYISTTYDPNKNGVLGRDHYNVKFVLDGKKIAEDFGVFDYSFYLTYASGGGEHIDEKEIGVDTRLIDNLKDYTKGLVILVDIFSRTFVQDMMYTMGESSDGFLSGGRMKAAAPRGIEAFRTFLFDWKKPIWVYDKNGPRNLNPKEKSFLKDLLRCHIKGNDFQTALENLADKYNIRDHFDGYLDKMRLQRERKLRDVGDILIDHLTGSKIGEIDEKKTRTIISAILDELNFGGNMKAVFMADAEKFQMFRKEIPPVEWSIVFKDMIRHGPDEAADAMEYVSGRNSTRGDSQIDDWMLAGRHPGTSFH